MDLTLDQERKLKATGYLLLLGIFLGPLYVIFSDGFVSVFPFINSVIAGVLIALNISFYEFVLFSGKIRKLSFYKILILRISLYIISIVSIILVVLIFARMFKYDLNFYEVLISDEFKEYIFHKDFVVVVFYAFGIVVLTNFTIQMNRKMGQGVLFDLITGKYYSPKKVEMIVMFIRIPHTNELIEKIGRLGFHIFLNEVIYDITEIILLRQGIIYEYVEGEFVLVWKTGKGLKDANCIRSFFEMRDKLAANREIYYEKYQFLPDLHASVHMGGVIVGEVGELKSEIKYLGDTMNTTSRILGETNEDQKFICSGTLLEKLNLPFIYSSGKLGEVNLRGKSVPVELYRLDEKELIGY